MKVFELVPIKINTSDFHFESLIEELGGAANVKFSHGRFEGLVFIKTALLDETQVVGETSPNDLALQIISAHDKAASISTAKIKSAVGRAIDNALAFGDQALKDFINENVRLGITQAGKTSDVRKAMSEVLSAIQTGSLHDAIVEIRAIPVEAMDETFLSETRLLRLINRIEDYLGLELSDEL